MPFNVLLLPLLGGYVFITYWNKTRFDAKRYSGERLLFQAAFAGVFFLILAYVITRLVMWWTPQPYEWWHAAVPFPHTGTSLLAFVLGATVWLPLNKWYNRDVEIQKTIEEWNDYLEILLKRALEETREVAITLKNGKVYVGFVVRSFDPAYDRKYLVILPTSSGYRDSNKHILEFTTDYSRVYEQLIKRDDPNSDVVDDFELVLPVAEVLSAGLFDWEVYRRFNPPSIPAQPRPQEGGG